MNLYQSLKASVELKGYKFFDNGDYNLNLIFVRNSDTFTNHFDDDLFVPYRVGGAETVLHIACTTKAGLYGHGSATQPLAGGTKVLVPNQYIRSHQWIPKGKGWGNGYHFAEGEFFAQKGTLKVWSDGDRDNQIDHVAEQLIGNIGLNIHKMSPRGVVLPSINEYRVDNWSNACCGSPEPYFMELVPIVNKSVEVWGSDLFTLTLLEKADLVG
jgi:hypothetical protein